MRMWSSDHVVVHIFSLAVCNGDWVVTTVYLTFTSAHAYVVNFIVCFWLHLDELRLHSSSNQFVSLIAYFCVCVAMCVGELRLQ